METMSSGAVSNLFPSLGPALVISMEYVDLGKWLAAVEGGARFGYDLMLLMLFFNSTAILCQYLAACIGTLTGRDLAQICREEYSESTCFVFGAQAELSLISSDVTMIIGIAHGLNLLLGVDFFVCMCFASGNAILLPFLVTVLGSRLAEASYARIAGLALLFYIFGVLLKQPEISLGTHNYFPMLDMENIYLLMALLGANIMSHNFYVHSAMVHKQRRIRNVPMDVLFNDHFFAILLIFTGIFLVNYVLMNSAAFAFRRTDAVLVSQDISMLIDQIFGTPVAPVGFLLVLLFSSYIRATTWNIGGALIWRHLFGSNLSTWVHHLIVKALTVILVLFFAKSSGSEGIYQLLIFCQVVQAMLLPSSVFPLLRVASSRSIMGTFRLSWHLEVLVLLVFVGVTASDVFFISVMSFGNSCWVQNIREGFCDSRMVLNNALLIIGFMLIGFTFYLVATPLKSTSRSYSELWAFLLGEDQREPPEEMQDDIIDAVTNVGEDQRERPEEMQDDIIDEVTNVGEDQREQPEEMQDDIIDEVTNVGEDQREPPEKMQDDIIDEVTNVGNHTHPVELPVDNSVENLHENLISESNLGQSARVVDINDDRCEQSPVLLPQSCVEFSTETKDSVKRDLEVSVATKEEKEEHKNTEECVMRSLSVSNAKELGASNVIKEKGLDCGSGSGSISKVSGLGRGTRVKVAAILNDFWEHLFDYHGKITQEANDIKLFVLLESDFKFAKSSIELDATARLNKDLLAKTDPRIALQPNSMKYNSPIQMNLSNSQSAYGIQVGSPSGSQSMGAFITQGQTSSTDQFKSSDRLNSAARLPQYADNRDYQPATIHGYQLASYLKEINEGRSHFSSSMSTDPLVDPISSASFSPIVGDPVLDANSQNVLNLVGETGLQSPTLSQANIVPLEGNYYAPSFVESAENIWPYAYTRKYHTSPDIYELIAASKKASLNEKWSGPIDTRPSSPMMTSGQPQPVSSASRTDVPLPFDEVSPPKFQRDVFSPQSDINPGTMSLWSIQPCEQISSTRDRDKAKGVETAAEKPSNVSQEFVSYVKSETRLLQYLRFCIMELLKLDGSDWLFRQSGGCDEDLIDQLAETEKYLRELDRTEIGQVSYGQQKNHSPYALKVPCCGDSCSLRASLVVSFGVWCIRRILELSLVESRPDLWGKYTYILNRLQGILDLAFSTPQRVLSTCSCLEIHPKESVNFYQWQQVTLLSKAGKPLIGSFTTANMILGIIKDVELAISCRKGRSGTTAGDIAFPKGKENLASVLKRYKRRLSSKSK